VNPPTRPRSRVLGDQAKLLSQPRAERHAGKPPKMFPASLVSEVKWEEPPSAGEKTGRGGQNARVEALHESPTWEQWASAGGSKYYHSEAHENHGWCQPERHCKLRLTFTKLRTGSHRFVILE